MPTEAKRESVAALTEETRSAKAMIVSEYRGLRVSDLGDIRRNLRKQNVTYHVVKNRLMKIAAHDAGTDAIGTLLTGPTAVAFVRGEAVDAAKALKTFAKDNKALVIKGGYMDGRPLSVAEVEKIADLESREVLLAKLAGAMKANLSKAAGLFTAQQAQAARLFAALQEKKAAEGPAASEAPAAAEAPEAAEAPAASEDAADAAE